MTCCGSSRQIVVGSDDSVAFQLTNDGRAYDFENATDVTARLITTDASSSTGPTVTLTNTGENDWRSGYGVAGFSAAETATMLAGTYVLEIKVTQPVSGIRIFRTSEIVQVLALPA